MTAATGGAPKARLTRRQAELLEACIRAGYYEIPRRVTLRQLAADVGISPTSLSLALRRAEARLVVAHVAATNGSTGSQGVEVGGSEHRSHP